MEKLIALLLMGLLFHTAESDRQCDNSNTDPCNEAAMTVILGSQTQFPGETILNAYCNNFNTTINCIVDEARECANSRNKEVLAEYMEIQRIIQEICREGSTFRRNYLDSVPCYNRNLDKLRNCSSSIQEEVTNFRLSEVDAETSFELISPFKYECIKLSVVPNCRIRVAAENCGMKTVSILFDFESGISNLMIKSLCGKEHMAIWLDEFLSYALTNKQSSTSSSESMESPQASVVEVPRIIGEGSSVTGTNPNQYMISNLARAGKKEAKEATRGNDEIQNP